MRTMTNVTGDLAVTTVVAKRNGGIDFASGVWADTTASLETADCPRPTATGTRTGAPADRGRPGSGMPSTY